MPYTSATSLIVEPDIAELKCQSNTCSKHLRSRSAIVLAEESQPMIQRAIRRWFGKAIPKPFCNFVGNKTMLQHTWQRVQENVEANQLYTVLPEYFSRYQERFENKEIPGEILLQPKALGTGPGVFLALSHILAKHRDSTVLITPGDHFLAPKDKFCEQLEGAFNIAETHPNNALLITTPATWPCKDYRWVKYQNADWYSESMLNRARLVASIHNSRSTARAYRHFKHGEDCYTGMVVAKASTLWQWCREIFPDVFERMSLVRQSVSFIADTPDAKANLEMAISHAYYRMKAFDVLNDILSPRLNHCRAIRLDDIDWDDWGRPERILDTIYHYGLNANFPLSIKPTLLLS